MGGGRSSGGGRNAAARTGGGAAIGGAPGEQNSTALGRVGTEGGEPLSRVEKSAVNDYQNESYRNVNRILRGQEVTGFGNKEKIREEANKTIAGVDKAFTKAPRLKETTKVLRGVNEKDVASILSAKNPVGKTLTDKAYVSTTLRKGGYYLDRKVVMEITVPKGTKVLQPRGGNRREREVLLNRGTKLKVTGVEKRQHVTQGEQIVLKMTVVK
jgi:hypothetical protein